MESWGWESGSVNKIPLLNREDLSLDTQNPNRKPGTVCASNSRTWEVGTGGSPALTYQSA